MEESFKEKLPIIISIILFFALCIWAYFTVFVQTTDLFTKIDNSNVHLTQDNVYEYNLRAYNEHGKMQDVTFTANKELREDAYLRLETMSLRGVVKWEEISFDELPADVRFRYKSSE